MIINLALQIYYHLFLATEGCEGGAYFFVKSSRFKTDEGGPFNSSDSSDIVDRWLKTILVQVKNMKYAIIAIPIPNGRLPQPSLPYV